MPFVVLVARKREEKGRAIESVFFAKLSELFGRGLFAENRDCRIAWDEFD
jgi:hypothetical protein